MRICRRCGVYAAPGQPSCDECGADLGAHGREVPQPKLLFAAIKMEFTCRGCGLWSPLDELDVDGAVRCARCGLDQKFHEKWWKRVLGLAHAVADLYGEHPEGRKPYAIAVDGVNPFAAPAQRYSGIRVAPLEAEAWADWLPENLRAWVAPGRPIGPDSGEPYNVVVEGPGVLYVRTSRGESGRYVVSPSVGKLHRGLLGAIADEHRADREEPDVAAAVEARAIRCGSCGASLPFDGELKLVRCSYCTSVVHVPARLRHAMQKDPRPDLWWLVFEGRSPYRAYLERHPRTSGQKGERPVEDPPVAVPTPFERATGVVWFVMVPTGFLLVAAVLARLPAVFDWLSRVLEG